MRFPMRALLGRSADEQHPRNTDDEERKEEDHAENRAQAPIVRGTQIAAAVVHRAGPVANGVMMPMMPELEAEPEARDSIDQFLLGSPRQAATPRSALR